jgi:E3 ubiquitin-protein ligase UBR1
MSQNPHTPSPSSQGPSLAGAHPSGWTPIPHSVPLHILTRQLAPLVGYSIKYPGAVTSIYEWLYSFALAEEYREWFFYPGAPAPEIDDKWSLGKAQDTDGTAEYGPGRKGKPCGHVFKKGETVYRCHDCGVDNTCVFCARCFHGSVHEGHEISFHIHNGGCGCCDCGDLEAWRVPIDCKYHSAPSGSSYETETPTRPPPPKELQRRITETIANAVDFLLATIERCPDEARAARHTATIKSQVSPEEAEAGKTQGEGPWAAVLWNDEKHSYAQVINTVMRALPGTTREDARHMAIRIDTYVRLLGVCCCLCG